MDSQAEIVAFWAPRVEQAKIRRLYETDARGIYDDELIDVVGYALYARCKSILTATEASNGRATCPRCEHTIAHQGAGGTPLDEVLHCPHCGWEITWGAYFKSYQHKQLHGGGAVDMFEDYVKRFPIASSARDKMLAIDRLIHAYHWELINPTRPVAVNLIGGSMRNVIALLEELTYGPFSTQGLADNLEAWQDKRDRAHALWSRKSGDSRD